MGYEMEHLVLFRSSPHGALLSDCVGNSRSQTAIVSERHPNIRDRIPEKCSRLASIHEGISSTVTYLKAGWNSGRPQTDIKDTMQNRFLQNHRWIAWVLCAAFVSLSVTSHASWQCLDGHPCPPGCSMQHEGAPGNVGGTHACCITGSTRAGASTSACKLCATAAPSHKNTESCTSPICVKHIQAKPHVAQPQSHVGFVFDFDSTAILLPAHAPTLVPEVTALLISAPPRAPPGRAHVCAHTPRGPPSLL